LSLVQNCQVMSHLTAAQRYTISVMYAQNFLQTQIAETIGKSPAVICRELKRNSREDGLYDCDFAQAKYKNTLKTKPRAVVFTETVEELVKEGLGNQWSPEQISQTAQSKGVFCVSHETIYQYVWKDKANGGKLYENLRNQGKRNRKRGAEKDKRGSIKDRVSIHERPTVVDEKTRVGDWEGDTIIGKNHKGAILTTNERKSGFLLIAKLGGKHATDLAAKMVEVLSPYKSVCHTMTFDNGKEFAQHTDISKALDVSVYFADPYASWQRGANENTNGLIRQYIPKKTDFDTISDERLQEIQDLINNRPRKRLDWKTPNEVFHQLAGIAFDG
jgi:transposase, IS30 family